MRNKAIEQVLQRAENTKADSDFTYYFSLLLSGEALFKIATLSIIAAISDDKDRNRYRLEHSLVRADSLGEWGKVLEDALTGPASQYLLNEAYPEQAELTRHCRSGEWQYESVTLLKLALDHLNIESEAVPVKSDMKRWFRMFVILRNKTRGHGAMLASKSSEAAKYLLQSIITFYQNYSMFNRQWAYLYRNISGKYRVSSISDKANSFDFLKSENFHQYQNGVYINLGVFRVVPLLQSDPELRDFYFANGGFSQKRFELISYLSDDKVNGDSSRYLIPPGTLPPSKTEGYGELLAKGNCFSNVPEMSRDYIQRSELETELFKLLMDDRRHIVTLVGKGGVGKTSLALKVISQLYEENRYDAIVWFSARDVDLYSTGPKPVRPLIQSPEDVSDFYLKLLLCQNRLNEKGIKPRDYFEQQLQKSEIGNCLFVFDNFETTQNPIDMFNWVDTFIRLPNKVLITTRLREFKGDYPLEVPGMTISEAKILISQSAGHLGISQLLTEQYINELISKSEGHPYVIKVLLGEVSKNKRLCNIPQLIAASDEMLTALFERTYDSLTPCAQRIFMTLAAWNSAVPRIALEATLLRTIAERQEVEKGIESILQYSLAELYLAPVDQQEFLVLPLIANVFGKKKLSISPLKHAIQSDVEVLQMLGPSRHDDVRLGLANRLESFIKNISHRIEAGESFETYEPMLEMICRNFSPGWLILARWHMEQHTSNGYLMAKKELERFLENNPADIYAADAWRMLGYIYNQIGDTLGEMHSFIELAQLSSIPFSEVSNTANKLNKMIRGQQLNVDWEEKRQLALRLAAVLEKRQKEAGPDDLSRMAWLALNTGQEEKAREFVKAGLKIEPNNYHCRNVTQRLNFKI